jgi:hypothetical protein
MDNELGLADGLRFRCCSTTGIAGRLWNLHLALMAGRKAQGNGTVWRRGQQLAAERTVRDEKPARRVTRDHKFFPGGVHLLIDATQRSKLRSV